MTASLTSPAILESAEAMDWQSSMASNQLMISMFGWPICKQLSTSWQQPAPIHCWGVETWQHQHQCNQQDWDYQHWPPPIPWHGTILGQEDELSFCVHVKPNQQIKYLSKDSSHTSHCFKAIKKGVCHCLTKLAAVTNANVNKQPDKIYPDNFESQQSTTSRFHSNSNTCSQLKTSIAKERPTLKKLI